MWTAKLVLEAKSSQNRFQRSSERMLNEDCDSEGKKIEAESAKSTRIKKKIGSEMVPKRFQNRSKGGQMASGIEFGLGNASKAKLNSKTPTNSDPKSLKMVKKPTGFY